MATAIQSQKTESAALRLSASFGLFMTVLSFLIYNTEALVPFARGVSMAWVILIGSAIVALGSFLRAYNSSTNKLPTATRFDTIILAIAYTLFTAYIVFLLLLALAFSFRGLAFDPYTASWLTGLAMAAVSYVVYSVGANLNATGILGLLTATMLGGVITSMISSSNPEWWQYNFSTLGMYDGTKSSLTFNFTLILSGVVIAILAKYLLHDIDAPKITRWVKQPLMAMGLSLAAVGLFSYDPAPLQAFLHNGSAGLIVISFITLVYGIRKTLPQLSQDFMKFSYVCVAAIVACYLLFTRIGYFSLTAAELGIFVIAFAWIAVFARNIIELGPDNKS